MKTKSILQVVVVCAPFIGGMVTHAIEMHKIVEAAKDLNASLDKRGVAYKELATAMKNQNDALKARVDRLSKS